MQLVKHPTHLLSTQRDATWCMQSSRDSCLYSSRPYSPWFLWSLLYGAMFWKRCCWSMRPPPSDLPLGGSATKAFEFNFKFNKVFLNQSQVLGHTIRTVKGKVSWTTHTSLHPGAWREKGGMIRIISVHCQLHTCVMSDEIWDPSCSLCTPLCRRHF